MKNWLKEVNHLKNWELLTIFFFGNIAGNAIYEGIKIILTP